MLNGFLESPEWYKDLIENANDLVQAVDNTGKIIYVNRKWKSVMGYTAKEAKKLLFTDILRKDQLPHCKRVFAGIMHGKAYNNVETVFITKNNKEIHVAGSINTFRKIFTRSIFRDITKYRKSQEKIRKYSIQLEEQNKTLRAQKNRILKINKELRKTYREKDELAKSLEKRILRRTREIRRANKEIKKLLEKRTEFLKQVSHDLRTPLTSLLLNLDSILKTGKFEKDTRKRLKIMQESTDTLSYLVTDVLNLVKLEQGKQAFVFRKTDIASLFEEFIQSNIPIFEKEKIKVTKNIQKNLPKIYLDKKSMLEVLNNIVSNSRRYMSKDKEIIIQAKRSKNGVLITIADNGKGVPEDKVDMLFDEFYKVEQFNVGSTTGLGLPICRKIIAAHKGKIWAESHGKGLAIMIKLPRKGGSNG